LEISIVRRHLQAAMAAARERARQRRERSDGAQQGYGDFLEKLAVPLARQLVNALKAEGYAFTVSTPGRGLRVSSDHGRDDFVELELRTDVDEPAVVGRIRRTRGSRTIEEEIPVKANTAPTDLTENDLLEFFLRVLEPWLER
jgi:hypothetical protein